MSYRQFCAMDVNEGFAAGEFARVYYVLDTDYDYYLLKQIMSDKQPDWSLDEDDLK